MADMLSACLHIRHLSWWQYHSSYVSATSAIHPPPIRHHIEYSILDPPIILSEEART
jgi:hypothetical protein